MIMDEYTACELAYKNGYEKGCKEMVTKVLNDMYNFSKRHTWMCLSPEDIEMFADKYGVEVCDE